MFYEDLMGKVLLQRMNEVFLGHEVQLLKILIEKEWTKQLEETIANILY